MQMLLIQIWQVKSGCLLLQHKKAITEAVNGTFVSGSISLGAAEGTLSRLQTKAATLLFLMKYGQRWMLQKQALRTVRLLLQKPLMK